MAKKRKSETPRRRHPITEETHHLFHDADPSTPMFRVVVKANLSMPMADNLIASIAKSFAFISVHNQNRWRFICFYLRTGS